MEIGSNLRSFRKIKGMSQKDLCEGICSQSMLSQIEKNINIPSFYIIRDLCNKLEISLDDLSNMNNSITTLLKEEFKVQLLELFYKRKYQQIYKLILSDSKISYFQTPTDKQLVQFYKAVYLGYEENNLEDAYLLLEKSLQNTYFKNKKDLTYLEILILNNLGIISMKLNLIDETYNYFHIIITDLETNKKVINESKITLIYYNIANAYSKSGQYEKALSIAIQGIAWANKPQISTKVRLSYLYYTKAYCENILNISSYVESYKIAYYLAIIDNDKFLMRYIQTKINID
ncbi:helix-turn-helix domain-containing protein [Lysinibacillus sp. NPDC093688]|uniref:helix-turn-helix domain-containing protein n=1 Tax=Lysinibacillus sp. NPDC093688 TaxID=3390577 RepID=UPI003D0343B7